MMEHSPSGGFPQLGGLVEGHSHTDRLDDLSRLRISQTLPCLECRPSQHYLGRAIMAELVVDRLPAHSCVLVCISGTWSLAHTVRRHLWTWRSHLRVGIAAEACSGSVSLVILRHLFGHLTLRSSHPKERASHSGVWGKLGWFSQRPTPGSEPLPLLMFPALGLSPTSKQHNIRVM